VEAVLVVTGVLFQENHLVGEHLRNHL